MLLCGGNSCRFPYNSKSVSPKNNFEHKPQHTVKTLKHPLPLSEGAKHRRKARAIAQDESTDYRDLWPSLLLFTAHVGGWGGQHADYLTQMRAEEGPDNRGVITRGTKMDEGRKRTREGKKTVHRSCWCVHRGPKRPPKFPFRGVTSKVHRG